MAVGEFREEKIRMALMQQRVVKIISKSPSERRDAEIQMVLPWLRKKSELFTDLDKSE